MPSQHPSALGAVLLVAAVTAACKSSSEPSPPGPASRVDTTAMFRHEVVALAAHDALVRGDLASAQRHARDLATRASVDGSPEAAEGLGAMRSSAQALATASDIPRAAARMGSLVRTCAECHARLTGPVRLEVDWPPRREADPSTGMRRHAWAMNQLWNGLIGNSEDPWRGGANVLAEPSLAPSELVPKKSTAREIDELAGTVQRLGERAAATSDVGLRSEVYGELLATCADCHARTR